jgi:hypothetical protein
MMNLRKFTFILSLLITAGLSAFSQTDSISLSALGEKTAKFNNDHPVEKVYLHFDKPYYAVGDTVWFKAYVTADAYLTNTQHVPSTISSVVYVDIISGKDSIVRRLKLPVNNSVAFGDLVLSRPLYKQGGYRFRAYTNWMRNSDAAYFFNKTINVGNAIEKEVFTNISLSGSAKSNNAKIEAKINYKDAEGHTYANRKISWKIQNTDDETIGKGKGVTDGNGDITITFSTNKPVNFNTSLLITAIDITEQKTLSTTFPLKHATAAMDVQFFPEGGDLLSGVKSKVAFKAIRPDGLGVAIKGTVTDNSGATVATLTTQHLGMGVFSMVPETGKTYKANVTFPDGTQNSYDLPAVKNDGVTLSVINTDPEKISLRISTTDQFFQTHKGKPFYIVAQNGQMICYAAQTPPLLSKVYPASIPKSKFPTGVLKLTLFATNGQALAERVIFIQRNDQLNLTLAPTKPSYNTRQQVIMNVSAKNATLPALANLSVTVLDESKVPFDENAETTILTSLLLTSDLKGYVEKPNYYFNKPTEQTNADLDVLMLTQGYSRFSYKDILANRIPAVTKYLPEDGIAVTGTLRTAEGRLISRGNVNFIIKGRVEKSTVTNVMGEFTFSKLFFPDSSEAVLNAKGNVNANNLMILPDNVTAQPISVNTTAPDEVSNIDSSLNNYLLNSRKQYLNSHQLKEVVIRANTVKKPSHTDFPALNGLSSIPDHVIPNSYFVGCNNLFECLKSGNAGLQSDMDKLYIRRDYNQGNRDPVAVYYNGMPVDFSYLVNVMPVDVESVEVFASDGLSSINKMTGTNGVIVINSKVVPKTTMTKDQIKELMAPQYSAVPFTPKGYTMARSFYTPRYDVSKDGAFGGDLRSTIYWNPKVLTDKTTGNATFDYYTSDGKGSYRAIIEGIDINGNVGRTVVRYKVQ